MMKPASIFSAMQGDNSDDFSSVALSLASPEKIRTWSYGEVRLPETINYRTLKPEPGGLFCAQIFGPVKDYECLCGKYKRMKFRGVICEKCHVEVTLQRVRRERMGHIQLACPVAHILFFKSLPSRIALMMNLTMRDIERILYYEAYVVLDPKRLDGKTWREALPADLHSVLDSKPGPGGKNKRLDDVICRGAVMSVKEYQDGLCASGGNPVVVGIGAEGLYDYLKKINLEDEVALLQEELAKGGSETQRKKILKHLKLAQYFLKANLRPEWMILKVLPVLPADLRPLVPLESGRFTNSDINDLYRRVINRNNRLKRLTELGAPEVIVNNEKRMLQEAVDALLDNGRRGKPAIGSNKRVLKSLADTVKGKTGRFRQNLLGKRVDFSGRSAIVVGPNLKLHQCGLPKQMALELFRPFVLRELTKDARYGVGNVKQARQKIDEGAPEVWDALGSVIHQHPVLLNRAPTLHRLGIQAFEPVLTEGKAIQLHPLVCVAFNADFDGDQMAVHVPIFPEAQAEARVLMLSSNNILAPANGEPVIVPTQDVVFGLYYTTRKKEGARGEGMRFADAAEVERALAANAVSVQAEIELLMDDEDAEGGDLPKVLVKTTVGRALIQRFLPRRFPTKNEEGEEVPGRRMKFAAVNKVLKKRDMARLVNDCFRDCGLRETVMFCDKLMRFGFEMATRSGLSMCVNDMRVPDSKARLIDETEKKIRDAMRQYQGGLLTEDERYNKSVDEWDDTGERIAEAMMKGLSRDVVVDEVSGKEKAGKDGKPQMQESFNSIYMMADSGARGSPTQIKQLAGMRGLMTRPDGRIMERAITANFREGLSVLQYFVATHGGRKGLTDTALKTANSGYLTRRLVDVTQDVVIIEHDCGCTKGITLRAEFIGGEEVAPLRDRILGRFLAKDVVKPQSGEKLFAAGEYLDEARVLEIDKAGVDEVVVRSPVLCETRHGLCAKCYGRDLGRGDERDENGNKKQDGVALGEAVGIIAAQSIGEPGTQLTMRTFHIGGAASSVAESEIRAKTKGKVRWGDTIRHVVNAEGEMIVVSQGGEISVHDESGQERERHRIHDGDTIKVKDEGVVAASELLVVRDPLMCPIVAEFEGKAKLENVDIGFFADEQIDESTGLPSVIIREKARQNPPKKVEITDAGDSRYSRDYKVGDKIQAHDADVENKDLIDKGKKQMKFRTLKGLKPQLKFIGDDGGEVKSPGTKASVTISLTPKRQEDAVLILDVREGQQIKIGDIIAREPLKAESHDITGGLPRVAELFEARQPSDRDSAMLAGAEGRVALRGIRRTKQVLAIIKNYQSPPEITAPNGRNIIAKHGDDVKKDDIVIAAEEAIISPYSGKVALGNKDGKQTVKVGKAKMMLVAKWRKLSIKAGDEVAEGDEIAAAVDAVKAPMAGRVEISDPREGTLERVITFFDEHEHLLPKDSVIRVQDGSIVKKGEEIVEGKINPHIILEMRGLEALVEHIVKEVQEVYRLQGVSINDKHIEVIVRQMMRTVEVVAPGDTDYLPGDRLSYVNALEENEQLVENGGKPMKFRRILLGITKASLQTDSFISEASFQETTRVLTDAAVRGRRDYLRGLKENIIVGRLIPAGTGYVSYRVGERDRLAEEADERIRLGWQEQEEQSAAAQPDEQPDEQPDNPAA